MSNNMINNMILGIIQIVSILILPVILVYFKIIPFKYRRHALAAISIVVILLCITEKITLKQLGIRTDNIVSGLIPYALFTILGVLILYIISKMTARQADENFYSNKKFIIIIVVGSIIQEFLYRGFLIPKLYAIFADNTALIILVNVVLFTLVHIIYSNTRATIITIFIAGIFFSGVYLIYPNLILISLSHIVLNQAALRYNFFREENVKKTIKETKHIRK